MLKNHADYIGVIPGVKKPLKYDCADQNMPPICDGWFLTIQEAIYKGFQVIHLERELEAKKLGAAVIYS